MIVKDYNGLPVDLDNIIEIQITKFPDDRWHIFLMDENDHVHKLPENFSKQFSAIEWIYHRTCKDSM